MININRLLVNANKLYPGAKLEATFPELAQMSDPKRTIRAKTITMQKDGFKGVTQSKESGHAQTLWEIPSQTGSGSYIVTLEVQPKDGTLFKKVEGLINPATDRLFKDYKKRFNPYLFESDIAVHCTCKDFYWSGMKYNANKRDHLAHGKSGGHAGGNEQDIEPKQRDPEGKHVLCKHIIAMKPLFRPNSDKVVAAIREFNKTGKVQVIDDQTGKDGPPLKNMIKLEGEDRDEFVNEILGGVAPLEPTVTPEVPEEEVDVIEPVAPEEVSVVPEELEDISEKIEEQEADEEERVDNAEEVIDSMETVDEELPTEEEMVEEPEEVLEEPIDLVETDEDDEEDEGEKYKPDDIIGL
jgi:hypothetical protein